MFNFLKLLGIGAFTVSIPAVTCYSISGTDSNIEVFSFDGSSSMRPIMDLIMKKYSFSNKNVIYNISVVGSNSGLSRAIDKLADFALVSHDISRLPKDKYENQWTKSQLKHIKLASEFIVVIYKPNKNCNKDLVISKSNISKLYSLFSGYSYSSDLSYTNLKDYLEETSEECDVILKPWVKNIGPVKSGTSKAFVDNPILNVFCDSETESKKTECTNWLNKVKNGYGFNSNLRFTSEPINIHWNNFKINLKPGDITYFPSSFVFSNWAEFQKLGLKIAGLKESNEVINLTSDNYQSYENKYKWERVFNLVYSVDNLSEKKKKLVEYIVKNLDTLKTYKLISNSSASSENVEEKDNVNDLFKSSN